MRRGAGGFEGAGGGGVTAGGGQWWPRRRRELAAPAKEEGFRLKLDPLIRQGKRRQQPAKNLLFSFVIQSTFPVWETTSTILGKRLRCGNLTRVGITFQSTLQSGKRLVRWSPEHLPGISIHASLAGSDMQDSNLHGDVGFISIHASRVGKRHGGQIRDDLLGAISIHASRVGSDLMSLRT